jgi:2-aminoethylphosphonate-pyruvate transaminase
MGPMGIARRRSARSPAATHVVHETAEDTPPDLKKLEAALAADKAITHVFAVHCETTSGILNPLEDIAAIVANAMGAGCSSIR